MPTIKYIIMVVCCSQYTYEWASNATTEPFIGATYKSSLRATCSSLGELGETAEVYTECINQ